MIGDRLALRNLVSLIDDWDQGQNRQADQRSENLRFEDEAEIGCVAGIEHCAETTAEAEEGWVYFKNQGIAAQHHYFDWNNPGYEGIRGYEEYLLRQNADISPAEARLAARRATQPIGTPEAIIEKIKTLQQTISMEKVVIHMMYGGMPRDKAEKSLRLFAEKVLPEVQAMSTPINPKSLG